MRGRKRRSGKRDAKVAREGKRGIRSHTAGEQRVRNRQTGAARRRHAPWQRDGDGERRSAAMRARHAWPGGASKGRARPRRRRRRDGCRPRARAVGPAHPPFGAVGQCHRGTRRRAVRAACCRLAPDAAIERVQVGATGRPLKRPAVRHRRTSLPSVTRRAIPLANGAVTNHDCRGSNARAASCPQVPVRKKRWQQGPRVHKNVHRCKVAWKLVNIKWNPVQGDWGTRR